MLATFLLVLAVMPACSTSGRVAKQAAIAPLPAHAIIFSPNGAQLASSSAGDSDYTWPSVTAIPWETTKTQSGGRTRVSAVRHNGDV